MSKTITLTGEDAELAQRAVAEIRDRCPELANTSDSDILNILIDVALLPKSEEEKAHQIKERSPL